MTEQFGQERKPSSHACAMLATIRVVQRDRGNGCSEKLQRETTPHQFDQGIIKRLAENSGLCSG
jgi:hypothetical protein